MANNATPNSATHEMAIIENAIPSARVRRMLGLSLHGWENMMLWSLALAAIFAAAVGISTYCVVQLQRHELDISKAEFDQYKLNAASEVAKAQEGVAKAGVEIANAHAEIAEANQRTAEFGTRTKEAELKLEQLRRAVAPRALAPGFVDNLKGVPGANVEILYVRDAPDTYAFAMQIFFAMVDLKGWKVDFPKPIREDMKPEAHKSFDLPTSTWVGGQPAGVSIVTGKDFPADLPVAHDRPPETAFEALELGFLQSLQAVNWSGDPALPPNTLRIVVAPRP